MCSMAVGSGNDLIDQCVCLLTIMSWSTRVPGVSCKRLLPLCTASALYPCLPECIGGKFGCSLIHVFTRLMPATIPAMGIPARRRPHARTTMNTVEDAHTHMLQRIHMRQYPLGHWNVACSDNFHR